jgi:hypothetical protein
MSRITVTVFQHGLQLEAGLSRLTREIQKTQKLGYKAACQEAERLYDDVHYTQVLHSESEELLKNSELQLLGEHIANGAPYTIEKE